MKSDLNLHFTRGAYARPVSVTELTDDELIDALYLAIHRLRFVEEELDERRRKDRACRQHSKPATESGSPAK